MGCDIHENVEYVHGGKWVRASDKRGPKCHFCKGTGKDKSNNLDKCYFCKGIGKEWHIGRNYMLFGILAGVRWVDADHIPPRGLPEDITKATKRNFYEGDDHSASYLTLKELLEMKEKVQVINAFVDFKNYIEFKKTGKPKFYSDYFYNEETVISNEEMERRLKLKPFWDGQYFYTKISWKETNFEIDPVFWKEFVPAMEKLHSDPEKVRFVFWFDN